MIFAIGLYELFIEEVDFPEWLIIHDLNGLKSKLISIIVLVLAVIFLEHLSKWENSIDTLLFGVSISLVSAALIAFNYFGHKK